MARNARVVVPGVAHHVTQRGNNRFDVFFVDTDREVFLQYPSRLLDLASWGREMDPAKWKGILRQHEDDGLVQSLRLAASRGRPLGSDRFIAKLETLLGQRLRALPCGRPGNVEATSDRRQERNKK